MYDKYFKLIVRYNEEVNNDEEEFSEEPSVTSK